MQTLSPSNFQTLSGPIYFELREQLINELSGSFSAEHGIGRKKIGWFQQSLPERHETLAKIKSVLDPNNTLNPGCLIDNIEK